MKALKENLKTITTYAGADKVNAEVFFAWTPSDTTLLEQLAMTGTLGNSFYANAKDATQDAAELLERSDGEVLAAAIVRGRNEGFIRAFPILGLVYLSKKDSKIFQETFNKVVLRGDSYMTSPIPEDEAAALNVHQIFGWNDSVIDYMKFVIAGKKKAA